MASAVFDYFRAFPVGTWSRGLRVFALVTSTAFAHAQAAEPAAVDVAQAPATRDAAAEASSLAALERTFRQTGQAEVGLALARALVDDGRWLEAEAVYAEVADYEESKSTSATAQVIVEATREREQLRARIPAIILSVDGNPRALEVFVNGVAVPRSELGSKRRVDPGAVRVRGMLDGSRVEAGVRIHEGETRTIRLASRPPAARPTSAKASARPATVTQTPSGGSRTGRVVSFVAMGIGGAALLTGGVFGVLAIRDQQSLSGRCPRDACPRSLEPDVDAYESKKTIAAVGLASGLALGLGGAALYLTTHGGSSPGEPHAGIGAFIAGDQAGVWGAF